MEERGQVDLQEEKDERSHAKNANNHNEEMLYSGVVRNSNKNAV